MSEHASGRPSESGPGKPPIAESLIDAQNAYKEAWADRAKPLRPEIVSSFFSAFWKEGAKKAGLQQPLGIPQLTHTAEELTALRDENKGVVLIPDEIMTEGPEGIALLHRMFPDTPMVQTLWQSKNLINTHSGGGCIEIEMDRLAPYNARLTAEDATDLLTNQGKRGQRLGTYLVGSMVSHALIGRYFDERVSNELERGPSRSRLSGTKEKRTKEAREFVREATYAIDDSALGDIFAEYVDNEIGQGIRVTRDSLMPIGARSERKKGDPEPERETGGEGYKWVDATPITEQVRNGDHNIHPIHAIIIPGENEEAASNRRTIVDATFTEDQRYYLFEIPTEEANVVVFCWKKQLYPLLPAGTATGQAGYRTEMKKFLKNVNEKFGEAGLPLFPSPLPIRAEMTEMLNTSSQGGIIAPKNI